MSWKPFEFLFTRILWRGKLKIISKNHSANIESQEISDRIIPKWFCSTRSSGFRLMKFSFNFGEKYVIFKLGRTRWKTFYDKNLLRYIKMIGMSNILRQNSLLIKFNYGISYNREQPNEIYAAFQQWFSNL